MESSDWLELARNVFSLESKEPPKKKRRLDVTGAIKKLSPNHFDYIGEFPMLEGVDLVKCSKCRMAVSRSVIYQHFRVCGSELNMKKQMGRSRSVPTPLSGCFPPLKTSKGLKVRIKLCGHIFCPTPAIIRRKPPCSVVEMLSSSDMFESLRNTEKTSRLPAADVGFRRSSCFCPWGCKPHSMLRYIEMITAPAIPKPAYPIGTQRLQGFAQPRFAQSGYARPVTPQRQIGPAGSATGSSTPPQRAMTQCGQQQQKAMQRSLSAAPYRPPVRPPFSFAQRQQQAVTQRGR